MRFARMLPLVAAACSAAAPPPDVQIPGRPPPVPDASAVVPAGTTTETWAIDRLFLGEAPQGGGSATSDAWKAFGYDLDGLSTTRAATDVCTLAPGASKQAQSDGDDGIDNAWGSMLLPILQSLMGIASPSPALDTELAKGRTTLEIEVTGLPDDASASAVGLRARAFVGAPTDGDAFDASRPWPVAASSVNDSATLASGARASFERSYVHRGTFVSGASEGPLVVDLPLQTLLALTIRHPIVTFDRASDGTISGTIAGVLDTQAFVASALSLAMSAWPALCADASAFAPAAIAIAETQDILSDGTNRAGAPCNGISIGLGFHARRIGNPTSVAPDETPKLACP